MGARRDAGADQSLYACDMIGDKDLDIQRESNSTAWVWAGQPGGKEVRYDRYFFSARWPWKTITCRLWSEAYRRSM